MSDSMQKSSSFPSQPKGKKRNRSDQSSESRKGESSSKHYGVEVAKLAEKGLVDSDSVERLVQLMQNDKSHRKADLSFRSVLAGVLAATERLDCLNLFVQRRGLPVLDEWLKEVRKEKVGSTAKDGDKQVEDFLLVLLHALDKLPVNLNALQMCNIGKSVNHLRSHKNLEIQKKARSLVDTWKQRVEAEMNNTDAKSSSSPEVPMPDRSKNEASYDWKKHSSASSDVVTKTSGDHASSKSASAKLVQGETTGRASSASSGIEKSPSPPGSTNTNLKQGQLNMSTVGGCSGPQTTAREEKSSNSSQSHTNSQYSSGHARKSGKEDANSSTAGSRSMNKTSGSSRHRKSANGIPGTTPSGAEKESGTRKNSTLLRSSVSEKVSQSTITCENALATHVTKSYKMILKIHNRGCSPGKSSTAGSVNELPCTNNRASSPALSEKCDKPEAVLKKKSSKRQTNKIDAIPDALPEGKQCGIGNDTVKLPDVPEGMSTAGKDLEANTSVLVRDDTGMNLVSSVAAGEVSRSGNVSLSASAATENNPSAIYKGTKQSNGAEPSRLSSISSADFQQKVEPSSGTYKKLEEFAGEASMVTSSAGVLGQGTIDESKEIREKGLVTDAIAAAVGSLEAEHVAKDGTPFEEEETGDSSLPCVSKYDTCVSKHEDEQSNTNQLPSRSISTEFKPPSLANYSEYTSTKVNNGLVAHSSDTDVLIGSVAKLKAEDTFEVDASGLVDVNLKRRDENDASNPRNEESGANSGKKTDCKDDILENKKAFVHYSGGSPAKVMSSSGELEPRSSSKNCVLIAAIEENKDKHSAAAGAASLFAAGVPDIDKKLEFDLNEGFNMDEMKSGELIDFAAPSLPSSVSSMGASYSSVSPASGCLAASVSVAAAAERPFVPPEDPLRNKTELGWKGLAATSAFRPAEPKKVLEASAGSSKAPLHDGMACKQVRPLLEIDLNVTDERILQDISIQNAGMKFSHKPENRNNSNGEFMGSRFLHCSGGFELDLNRVDEAPDLGQDLAGNSLHFQSFSSSAAAIVEASTTRDFDLNDGPTLDEKAFEPWTILQAHGNAPQPHFGLRMNKPTISSKSLWDSPGTTYSADTFDLNCGPGSLDVEGRDKILNISTRQLGTVSSQGLPGEQARTYQVTSGLSKRKEPDGGWDADGNSYKQSLWHTRN